MIYIAIALFVGACIGFFVACLLCVGSRVDGNQE
jgi:hypothetical protein